MLQLRRLAGQSLGALRQRLGLRGPLHRYLQRYTDMLFTGGLTGSLRSLEKPAGSVVVVLAPHPDDELIGCGGTLYKHRLAGQPVTCVYMTSGQSSSGHPELTVEERGRLREKEAERGLEILGISNLIFLRQMDGHLRMSDSVVSRLASLLEELQPDIVYLPAFTEFHPDHTETNRIAACAYDGLTKRRDFFCCAYETVPPLVPNCIVDIGQVIDVKARALEQHVIPRQAMDVKESTLALNRYRAITSGQPGGFSEAFIHLPAKDYFTLARRYLG